tara:strand:- start:474 stop:695 length:222 start_codon:yes stop_codon:yes gene_type:complete
MDDFKSLPLYELFDDIEELNTSLRELSDDDLIICRQSLINRTNRALSLIDELKNELNDNFTPSDIDLKNANLL